jgi:hypothetical protein
VLEWSMSSMFWTPAIQVEKYVFTEFNFKLKIFYVFIHKKLKWNTIRQQFC